jgi:hypothetical protein
MKISDMYKFRPALEGMGEKSDRWLTRKYTRKRQVQPTPPRLLLPIVVFASLTRRHSFFLLLTSIDLRRR